ncbi:MAG: prepilin-type N-terminal cleavage/methylation domain-containing protein [Candidatus Aceula lacicola]|nr:prepilin-type N-terminal cleavage/methylation domain-containing protein [Candidatus Aceula lacicola]
MNKKTGFTLMEVILVVIIVAILAAVAIPQYSGIVERTRASEGVHVLGAILSSMERYHLENSAYTNNLGNLDVTIPTLKFFGTPTVYTSCASNQICAIVLRNTSTYQLRIWGNGTVTCTSGGSSPNCDAAGY